MPIFSLVLSDNTCTGALAPGASCTFKVSFTPLQARAELAAITIGDGTSSWTVPLSGTGV